MNRALPPLRDLGTMKSRGTQYWRVVAELIAYSEERKGARRTKRQRHLARSKRFKLTGELRG
jgi:hypothetical protein